MAPVARRRAAHRANTDADDDGWAELAPVRRRRCSRDCCARGCAWCGRILIFLVVSAIAGAHLADRRALVKANELLTQASEALDTGLGADTEDAKEEQLSLARTAFNRALDMYQFSHVTPGTRLVRSPVAALLRLLRLQGLSIAAALGIREESGGWGALRRGLGALAARLRES